MIVGSIAKVPFPAVSLVLLEGAHGLFARSIGYVTYDDSFSFTTENLKVRTISHGLDPLVESFTPESGWGIY